MLSVLYVDDDPSLLNLGKIFLEMSGKLRIDTAASVGEALDKVQRRKYDGIISDYEMPGINGLEFLRHVRCHYRDLPFILFTGKGREEIAIEALNSGADFYLQKGGEQKPQFVELEHKLLTAIDRNRMRDDLKESRQQLSDLIDFLPDATFAINRENKVISWNRMMEKMTGVPPDAILGTGKYLDALSVINEEPVPLVDIVLNNDKTCEDAHPNLVWNGDKLTSELYSPKVYEGKGAFLWRIASPLYDSGGTVIGAIETIRDVTGRKEAEEKLRSTHEELNAAYEQLTATEEELRQNYDELTRNQQALVQSEERYRNVVEDQTEFICRFSPDGRLTFVNGAYCRYFGLDAKTCLGKPHTVVIPPDDLARVKQHLSALTPENPVGIIEHRITMPSGDVRWQRWSDRAVFDKNGSIAEYQSVGMDITGQKTAEEKLRSTHEELNAAYEQLTATEEELRQNYDELTRNQQALVQSEERYRNVVEDQTEFICRFSPDGRLTFVNGAYCRYFGLDAKTCLGKPHTVVIPPDDLARVKQHLSALTPENPVGIIEHRITMPSGDVRWQRWSDRAVFDKNGSIAEYQSVGMDITGQKTAEEKLISTHEELNAAYEQLTATEEELRQNYDELTRNQQALVQSEERYRNVVEDQTEFICRFSPDGRHIFVNNAYCRYFGKTREELIGHKFVPDIPKEDHPLIAAHFVSIRPDHPVQTVEHRIRMPSGEIRWQQWSDRAIFEKDGRVTEYQSVGRDITDRRHKDQALHEANKKLNLLSSITRHDIINQLTALQGYFALLEGRITDPGVRDLLKRAMQTGEVIRGQILFTQQYEDMGLQNPSWQDIPTTIAAVLGDGGFSPVNVDASLNGIEVFADPLLKQVFYNLFENAFMHGEHVTRIEVLGHEVPGGFDLVVADDGCGIPPADKQNIFVKGFGSHTGLGLFLTQEILTITSLTIRETGEYGRGARFEIHIPAARLRKASGRALF